MASQVKTADGKPIRIEVEPGLYRPFHEAYSRVSAYALVLCRVCLCEDRVPAQLNPAERGSTDVSVGRLS